MRFGIVRRQDASFPRDLWHFRRKHLQVGKMPPFLVSFKNGLIGVVSDDARDGCDEDLPGKVERAVVNDHLPKETGFKEDHRLMSAA